MHCTESYEQGSDYLLYLQALETAEWAGQLEASIDGAAKYDTR
jgi:hypothetical protein